MSKQKEQAAPQVVDAEEVNVIVDGKTLETPAKDKEEISDIVKRNLDWTFEKKPFSFEQKTPKVDEDCFVYKAKNFRYDYQITSQPAPSKLFTLAFQQRNKVENCMGISNLSFTTCKIISNAHSNDKEERKDEK